jgi:hypothetical protein
LRFFPPEFAPSSPTDLFRTAALEMAPGSLVTLEFVSLTKHDARAGDGGGMGSFGLCTAGYDPTISMQDTAKWGRTFFANASIAKDSKETLLYAHDGSLPRLEVNKNNLEACVVRLKMSSAGVVQVQMGASAAPLELRESPSEPEKWADWPVELRPGPFAVVIGQTRSHRLRAYQVWAEGANIPTYDSKYM